MIKRSIPKNFRKLTIKERRKALCHALRCKPNDLKAIGDNSLYLELADMFVESAVGIFPIPMGIATGFIIDGKKISVPLATEEPSVIAAASHGARIISAGGGFETWATDSIMTAQIFISEAAPGKEHVISKNSEIIGDAVNDAISFIKEFGGGFRGLEVKRLPKTGFLRIHIDIDVVDAMGANTVNTAAEKIRPMLEKLTEGKVFMCILTNTAPKRKAFARFSVPFRFLVHKNIPGREMASRIVLASQLAQEDPSRAITHNKGIMNGISALALATGNDTRAIEAASHYSAFKDGSYRGLSQYYIHHSALEGSIEMPLPFGTVGGAIRSHPATQISLKILGNPDARSLARIAAALGLAQNLAALNALVSDGIQEGHMKLHASRVAYKIGARGSEVRVLAKKMWDQRTIEEKDAVKILHEMRRKKDGSL